MRRHLNTLFITTEGAYLNKDGANIVVKVDDVERLRTPVHLIGGVVLFGRVSMSSSLIGYCLAEGICITHLTEYGKFLARLEGPVSGNVLLRRAQYRLADDPAAHLHIVRSIIIAKSLNQRAVIRRAQRDHGSKLKPDIAAKLDDAERHLTTVARRAEMQTSVDALRGVEGDAAATYFGVFDAFLTVDDPQISFTGRSRRPPLDPVNALLSFLYTLLTHDCRSALETVGLDPASGFLHALRPGRPSLALDLMEEFRPHLADRLALSLFNRKQIKSADFKKLENGAVIMRDEARKTVLVAWQERKKEEIIHPFTNEKISLGLLPHLQAQLLARMIRGDMDAYPPMIWK